MPYGISKVTVWVGEIADRKGGLAQVLEPLAAAGVNLEFVIARRQEAKPGLGLVFVSPIRGAAQIRAARQAGLWQAESMHSLRLIGPDRPGLGARIASAVAAAGVNMRGFSAASIGKQCVAYFAFDTADDQTKAARALKKALAK